METVGTSSNPARPVWARSESPPVRKATLRSRWWVCLPIAMMASIQYVSGLPRPEIFLSGPAALLGLDSASVGLSSEEADGLTRTVLNGLHLPVFTTLTVLWCWALAPWAIDRVRRALVAFVVCAAFAVLNEVSQLWVPGRLAAVHDGVVNLLGVALGLFLFFSASAGVEGVN